MHASPGGLHGPDVFAIRPGVDPGEHHAIIEGAFME
jgi:hypothetical protein